MALPASLRNQIPTIVGDLGATIVGEDPAAGDARATRLATAALEECFAYAPSAPKWALCEAATRYAGWLLATPANVRRVSVSDSSGTSQDTELQTAATPNGFRHSGAAALLSRYKVRRAGSIAGRASE